MADEDASPHRIAIDLSFDDLMIPKVIFIDIDFALTLNPIFSITCSYGIQLARTLFRNPNHEPTIYLTAIYAFSAICWLPQK